MRDNSTNPTLERNYIQVCYFLGLVLHPLKDTGWSLLLQPPSSQTTS